MVEKSRTKLPRGIQYSQKCWLGRSEATYQGQSGLVHLRTENCKLCGNFQSCPGKGTWYPPLVKIDRRESRIKTGPINFISLVESLRGAKRSPIESIGEAISRFYSGLL